jgi:peptidoglycan/xylan/chitin deacetylase (PgdA/CDA1 family)
MTFRQIKNWGRRTAEASGVIRALQAIGRGGDNPVYVLVYHRVDDPDRKPPIGMNLVSATPAQFEAQMRLIARHYHPITAEDVVNAIARSAPLPADAVLVTVDDGYRDFKDTIFPIAQRYGIRPVLFVPTAFVGEGRFWWDRLFLALEATTAPQTESPVGRLPLRAPAERAAAFNALANYVRQHPSFEQGRAEIETLCESLAPGSGSGERATLDWDELRALARQGATIAAHSHTHPILAHIPLEQARREIRQSQSLIEREIGSALPILAYPDGRSNALNAELPLLFREEGFVVAFTMTNRCAYLKRDPSLQLPRVVVSRRYTLEQFHLYLTPVHQKWTQLKR